MYNLGTEVLLLLLQGRTALDPRGVEWCLQGLIVLEFSLSQSAWKSEDRACNPRCERSQVYSAYPHESLLVSRREPVDFMLGCWAAFLGGRHGWHR